MTTTVTLIGKPGCHLCDDARAIVLAGIDAARDAVLVERSILDDEGLAERYRDEIPVVLIDDEVHDYWRVDAERFRVALDAVAVAR